MGRITRKISTIVEQSIIMILLSIVLISVLNFSNMQFHISTGNIASFVGKIDIINKMYYHVEVVDISKFFGASVNQKKSITTIIIHHDSVMNKDIIPIFNINEYHKSKGMKSIAYHYYIAAEGEIYKCHPDEELTYHASAANSYSIGVCLQGNFEQQYPSAEQIRSLTFLLMKLRNTYNIPVANIKRHSEVGITRCPGRNLNLEAIKQDITSNHVFEPIFKTVKRWINEL